MSTQVLPPALLNARAAVVEARREIARFQKLIAEDVQTRRLNATAHHQTMLEIWQEREQARIAVWLDLLLKEEESRS